MDASHPEAVAQGTNAVTVTATSGFGTPLPGAYVCLWDGLETHVGGVTGADGTVDCR